MKMILGSFVPSKVMADIASFMEIEDAAKLGLASPHANNVLFSYRTFATKTKSFVINECGIHSRRRSITLDDNVELSRKHILRFLRTVSELEEADWSYYCIDNKIIHELLRIKFTCNHWNHIRVVRAHITASNGKFKLFLAQNPIKVALYDVFVHPSLINDKVVSLLDTKSTIKPLNSDGAHDQISTTITDDLLKSPNFKTQSVQLRGFLNLGLSFPVILKYFEDMFSECPWFDTLTLGVIGFQEMPAVLQYWNQKGATMPETTLCHINNGSYLEFEHMFNYRRDNEGDKRSFGISLERDVNGVVENVVIPEDMVHEEAFEKFKELVKNLKSETPIDSIVPNRIRFKQLSIDFEQNTYPNYLVIRGSIVHPENSLNKNQQCIEIVKENVDQSLAEDIVVKLLKSCSSITRLSFGKDMGYGTPIKMNERLFTSLLEHGYDTDVKNEWIMKLQLSDKNLLRLLFFKYFQNQNDGIFEKLQVQETYFQNLGL